MTESSRSPVTRILPHADALPRGGALRDKDLGIAREWTLAHY